MSVLDNQSKLNPTTAFYAALGSGGGGGGGGGPVLNVSTINFNSGAGSAAFPAQQNMRNAGSGGTAGFNGAVIAFDMDPVPVSTIWFGYNSDNNALQMTQESGVGYTSAALQVDAILCSSINGAVPGGGGGANPVVSTLTAQGITIPTEVAGASYNLFNDQVTGYVNPLVAEGNSILAVEYRDPSISLYGPLGVGSLEVLGLTSAGVVPGVRVTSDAQGSLILQAPSTIQCQAVNSINFSTPSLLLNGAPIGGGGGGGVSGGIAVSSITSVAGQAIPNTISLEPGPGGNVVISGFPLTRGGDFTFDTNIPGNSVSLPYQPGGFANALVIKDPGDENGALNLGAMTAGGAVIASAAANTGAPSSLTITSDSVNLLQPVAAGASLKLRATDTNLYQIDCVSSAVTFAGLSLGFVGGRNQVYTNVAEVPQLFVSSINGAAPGGGGGGTSASRLLWTNSNSISLPSNATPGTFTDLTAGSAALTNGHTYRMTATFGLSNTVTDGFVDIVINGSWGGLPATVYQDANSSNVDAVPVYGYSGYFTAAGGSGGVTLAGFNSGSANATVFPENTFVILEDLGALA